MNLNRPLLALALGLSATGCFATADDPETPQVAPVAQALGKKTNTGTGMNGLKSADYWSNVNGFIAGLGTPASTSTGTLSSNFSLAHLVQKPDRFFYKYAFDITSPILLTDPWANPFTGRGYSAKEPWPTGTVSPANVPQILAVLSAFMNNNATSIPIAFTGSYVTTADDAGEFDLKEALFIVKQRLENGQLVVVPNVWISKEMIPHCNVDVYRKARYCEGQQDVNCHFVFRDDVDSACVAGADGTTMCDGVPALETYLTTKTIGTQDGCW
jgi:hypothetical protein